MKSCSPRSARSSIFTPPGPEAGDFLHLAAVASLTEVAVEEAKEEVEQNLRGSFLEELRSRPDMDPVEIVRRAGRLGCDLSRGAVGDGKVFVMPVEEAYRVRTGEAGEEILQAHPDAATTAA